MNRVNRITRTVVMAKNEVGVIADIMAVLANAGIPGIDQRRINLRPRKAVGDEVLVLRLNDEPGALAGVADKLRVERSTRKQTASRKR